MTNDEILQAAKEAEQALYNRSFTAYFAVIERLVMETEKRTIERCAVVAEKEGQEFFDGYQYITPSCYDISAAIRKLGEQ